MKPLIIISILIVTFITSCKKKPDETKPESVTLTCRTNFDEDITCNFYNNKEDYDNDINVFKSVVLTKNDELQTIKGFQSNTTYFYDCYSADKTTTSWLNSYTNITYISTKESGMFHQIAFALDTNTWHRNTLMPENTLSTTWKITAVWDRSRAQIKNEPLPDHIKHHKLIINRDRTVKYEYPENGSVIKKELFARINQSSSSENDNYFTLTLHKKVTNDTILARFYGPFSVNKPHLAHNNRTDTLLVIDKLNSYLYTRQ